MESPVTEQEMLAAVQIQDRRSITTVPGIPRLQPLLPLRLTAERQLRITGRAPGEIRTAIHRGTIVRIQHTRLLEAAHLMVAPEVTLAVRAQVVMEEAEAGIKFFNHRNLWIEKISGPA
jgi:hypothetical protein